MDKKLVSLVIPVFNEQAGLSELFRRIDGVTAQLPNIDLEVVFVDDGSTDESRSLLLAHAHDQPHVRVVVLARNFGHQSALLAGISTANGDAIITMDADLQDPPEIVPALIDAWVNGADVVHARRQSRRGESWFKLASASLFYKMIDWLSDTHLPRNVGDFRLIDRRVRDVLLELGEKSLYLRGMVAWVGFEQVTIGYDRDERFTGETKYPLKKMVSLATDAVLSFSERPLRIVTRLGLVLTGIAFSVLIFFLITIPFGHGRLVPGWLSVIVAVLILGGVQLVCLGIVGEYISRIYREAKGRPLFIIDKRRSSPDE